MEEDDEIQSPQSSESGSPASPMSNGRIAVTVAAFPPPPLSQNTVNLSLSNQQPKGGSGGRDDCWSEEATAVLIDAWGERYLELSRGNLKQKHWKEVANIVNSRDESTKTPKTDVQCKNRIDTVKKKYKLEKSRIIANGGRCQWTFFKKMEQLIGPGVKTPGSTGVMAASVATTHLQSDKVPMGIPVRTRPVHFPSHHQFLQQKKELKTQNLQFRKRGRGHSDSSGSEKRGSPRSMDSFPPEIHVRKRAGMKNETKQKVNPNSAALESVSKGKNGAREKDCSNPVRELTQAILKFGETYEQAESAKLQQILELEKQRMKFMTELESQRMRFFLKTQLEISELRHGKKV